MIISRTPFRVSLFGGGTDLGDYYRNSKYGYGAVISTAINRYTYITVNRRFDDMIRVSYSKTEYVATVDEIEHNIIREALKIVGIKKAIDIVYMADIPLDSAGIGLASSSSIAVGVLNALYAFVGKSVSAERLAREACRIEIEVLKHPIGKQDQYAVAYGGFNYYQFNSDESVYINPIVCSSETKCRLEKNMMFFYTGITRKSSSVLTEQKANIPNRAKALDELVEIVSAVRDSLQRNELSEIGTYLTHAWELKKSLASNISNPVIDEMYRKAINAGALGGKILGAGGGGFLMVYADPDAHSNIRKTLKGYQENPIKFDGEGSKIIYIDQ